METERNSIHPPAQHRPHLPARPPHHGADPVELVPALRPQPAEFRAQHHAGKPADYAKATQRIWHVPGQASAIELPVIEAER